ncbi:MAG: CDP-alcohol phosphatidyltransferase family protein [Acidimicrobiales bacterium]
MIDGRRGRKGSRRTEPGDSSEDNASAAPATGAAPTPEIPPAGALARIGLGRRLAAIGVTADQVTVVGMMLAALTGVVIALGHLWIGVALVTAGGLMDTLDGAVAKAAGSSSRRGAFLDSVADRVADGFIFGGVAWYLATGRTPAQALLPFAILAVGNVISYERAKAESLGWDAKGGLMERAERLIFLGGALIFHVVLIPLLAVLLGLCVFTAGQRFVKIWRQATAEITGEPLPAKSPARVVAGTTALAAWRPGRVESRWRAWREVRASDAGTRTRPVSIRSPRSRRRAGEPLTTRLRSVLASDRAGNSRSGRSSRSSARTSARLTQRRQEGAAAALRRRLGTGR